MKAFLVKGPQKVWAVLVSMGDNKCAICQSPGILEDFKNYIKTYQKLKTSYKTFEKAFFLDKFSFISSDLGQIRIFY